MLKAPCLVLSFLLFLPALAAPLPAQEGRHRPEDGARLERVLHGLEQGVEALKAIGREEEATHLNRIADGVRARLRLLREQVELLHHGVRILAETGHPVAAEVLERMILARKMRLEGRRDPEALEVYRSQPEPGAQVEVLQFAARLWAERGHERKAEGLAAMAEQTARRLRGRQRGGETDRPRGERPELEARVRRLEEQVRRLGRALERFQAERRPTAPLAPEPPPPPPGPRRRTGGTVWLLF